MIRDEFDALVARIERRYGGRPMALRFRIACILALGYGLFACWLMPLAGLAILFFAGSLHVPTEAGVVMILIGAVLLTYGVVQATPVLWMSVKEPTGRVIRRVDAPVFFERLDVMRRASGARRFQKVIITEDFGAGVAWIPRLGLFGWTKSYLLIGLPLLDALSAEQFEAVLAHELAHQSAKHGRFTSWIYRVRMYWERVLDQIHERNAANNRQLNWLLSKWIGWYWPRFNAYAFVLSRANEYQADRASAEWSGAEEAASALWRVGCFGQRLDEKFWPAMNQLAITDADPPDDLTTRELSFLASTPDETDATRWMDDVSLRLTNNLNTHPSFADRLKAIGLSPDAFRHAGFPRLPQRSATATLFEGDIEAIRSAVDASWQKEITEAWRMRHGRATARQRQLQKIETVATDADSNPETLWDKARVLLDLSGSESAEPVLRKLLEVHPAHSQANLTLGQHLLGQGNVEGQDFLLRILKQEEDVLIPHACEALSNFYQATGRSDQVAHVHRRLSLYEAASAAAHAERTQVLATDRFLDHGLSQEELRELRSLLTQQTEMAAAYLVQKELKHFVQRRLFVLCVHTERGWFGRHNADKDSQLAMQLATTAKLPGRLLVIAPSGGFRALARKVMRVPDARIV